MPNIIREFLSTLDDEEWKSELFKLLQNQSFNQVEVDLFELLCKVLDQNLFAQVDWARNSCYFKELEVGLFSHFARASPRTSCLRRWRAEDIDCDDDYVSEFWWKDVVSRLEAQTSKTLLFIIWQSLSRLHHCTPLHCLLQSVVLIKDVVVVAVVVQVVVHYYSLVFRIWLKKHGWTGSLPTIHRNPPSLRRTVHVRDVQFMKPPECCPRRGSSPGGLRPRPGFDKVWKPLPRRPWLQL